MGGSVGIGTVSPSSTLSIVGTADISGNLTVGSCTGCGGGGGWSLTGNAGTNSATNFIGTTDDVPFNIRVHNEKAGRIDEGDHNTFLGFKAGNANVTGGGLYNTGIGHSSLLRNTTGLLNIAIGFLSLENNTTGFGNVGVGYDALSLNDTGNLNTAIGHSAGAGATGSGNVFLGAQAGQGITADNQLWIDNANNATPLIFGNFSSRNVGIGTITPGSKLSVVGLPVYADDAAAGTGGLSAGDFYQTNGAGAITTAGVVMVKQ